MLNLKLEHFSLTSNLRRLHFPLLCYHPFCSNFQFSVFFTLELPKCCNVYILSVGAMSWTKGELYEPALDIFFSMKCPKCLHIAHKSTLDISCVKNMYTHVRNVTRLPSNSRRPQMMKGAYRDGSLYLPCGKIESLEVTL